MVAIEAMAAGLPVVATDVGSVRDLVADGETGRVVRLDPADLAEAAADLLLDPVRRRRLGDAGRPLASDANGSGQRTRFCRRQTAECRQLIAHPRYSV